jgi:hypothetical protein
MPKRKLGDEDAVCSRENWVRKRQYNSRYICVRRRQYAQENWVKRKQYARGNWVKRRQYAQEKTG